MSATSIEEGYHSFRGRIFSEQDRLDQAGKPCKRPRFAFPNNCEATKTKSECRKEGFFKL